jgi:hypothetical protein
VFSSNGDDGANKEILKAQELEKHLLSHLACEQLNREASLELLVCKRNLHKLYINFQNQLDTTHLRSGRGRFNPDSGSVGDNGESGVTAESRKRRIVTESGQRRRKATASEWLISDMFTPLTCIVIK